MESSRTVFFVEDTVQEGDGDNEAADGVAQRDAVSELWTFA